MNHQVIVRGVPEWVDATKLLGPEFSPEDGAYTAAMDTEDAADVAARLRNIGLGGALLSVAFRPRLKRPAIRAGRTRDARARRDTTPGFTQPGAQWDDEGRYSLTPESLALVMGKAANKRDVTDLGCGVGGNTIGFARAGCTVAAIERDPTRRRMALHNASVYGVRDRVSVATELDDDASGDLLFVDPPWGTEWNRERTVVDDFPLLVASLERIQRADFIELWAKLPPSFDPASVPNASARAVFGTRPGDRHRIKFVWLRVKTSLLDRAATTNAHQTEQAKER